jgi:hypothetical protein
MEHTQRNKDILRDVKESFFKDEKTFRFITSKYALFSQDTIDKINCLSEEETDDKIKDDNSVNTSSTVKNNKLFNPNSVFQDGKRNFIKNQITSELKNENVNSTKSTISRRFRRKLSKERRVSYELRRLHVNARNAKKSKNKKKRRSTYFTTGYSLPWCDDSLWTTISRSLPDSLPDGKPKISRDAIAYEDRESCKSYVSHSNRPGYSWLACFTKVAIRSAVELRCYAHSEGSKFDFLSISDAVEKTVKNTNSGLPHSTKKNNDKTISWTKNMLRHLFNRPTYGKIITMFTNSLVLTKKGTIQAIFELPSLIYHRFQIGRYDDNKPKVKVRQVWCVPQIIVALEAYYFYNFIEKCKFHSVNDANYKYSIAQNNALISARICLLKKVRKPSLDGLYNFYSLDYSKYDRSIPIWFVDIFFAMAKDSLKEMSKHESLIFGILRLFTKYTPFIYDGEIYFKLRGISSGLFITNFYDTLFNMSLIRLCEVIFFSAYDTYRYIMESDFNFYQRRTDLHKRMEYLDLSFHFDCVFLGDDGVVYWCERLVELLKKMCHFLGMEINIKNTSRNEDEDIFYLGRYWDKDNIPDQTFEYMVDHIIFRTKYYKEDELEFDLDELDVMRVLSICLALKSGKEFLNIVFKEWEPLKRFYEEKKTLHLMTGIFYEGKKSFKFDEIPTSPLGF